MMKKKINNPNKLVRLYTGAAWFCVETALRR